MGNFDHSEQISLAEFDKFENAFSGFDKSAVDCWVKTESLVNDMKTCLFQYEFTTGGQVNWANFNRTVELSRVNPTGHMPCSEFYDNDTAALVLGADRHIFELFGYETCCEEL